MADGPAPGRTARAAASWGSTVPTGISSRRPTPERRDIGIDPQSLDRTAALSDERAIVDAVLGGDREAFRRLVERESVALVRACHRILGDRADAEDAAQEAMVTAYRQLASWRGEGQRRTVSHSGRTMRTTIAATSVARAKPMATTSICGGKATPAKMTKAVSPIAPTTRSIETLVTASPVAIPVSLSRRMRHTSAPT